MTSGLTPVERADEWEAYHSIRRRVLWEARGLSGYDRALGDERAAGNHPFLFVHDGEPLGAIRVDVRPPVAWFRLVAVREDLQRRGHGRRMLEAAEQFAMSHGCARAYSNVDPAAVGFYQKLGFEERPGTHEGPSVPMMKDLQ